MGSGAIVVLTDRGATLLDEQTARLEKLAADKQAVVAAIAALEQMAVTEPWKFRGYGALRNPNVPYHPMFNTYRVWLSLENMNVPYHRCNPVVWKSGCP